MTQGKSSKAKDSEQPAATMPITWEERMCDQYPLCGLTQWSCDTLQDIVYERDVAVRKSLAREIRKDMAEVVERTEPTGETILYTICAHDVVKGRCTKCGRKYTQLYPADVENPEWAKTVPGSLWNMGTHMADGTVIEEEGEYPKEEA
jgi:hypothetical protein